MTFEHLPCTRIRDPAAVRPSPSLSVYPLNNIITHIQGMSIFGQYFHAVSIRITSRRKSIFPPTCAFDQCGTNWLRSAAIYIKNNRFNRLTVFVFLQAVPPSKPRLNLSVKRDAVIIISSLNNACARIRFYRDIIRPQVSAEKNGAVSRWRRCHLPPSLKTRARVLTMTA